MHDDDVVAALEELIDQRSSDEERPADHECPRHGVSLCMAHVNMGDAETSRYPDS